MAHTDELNQEDIQKIKSGFTINWMRMKDGTSGNVLWKCNGYDLTAEDNSENLPKELLECTQIVREINFSSIELIENLELVQNFYLHNNLIETSKFFFGFVIPNSTNNWEQIIEAKGEVIPHHILSGNLKVETVFLSNGIIICKNLITIFYI
jgi:retinal rod rhodopsin-sensitive cGMP 3',5'-cyclic phosphodiesterase subunit delta